MTKPTAEEERAAVVAWLTKRSESCKYYGGHERHPPTKRQWQMDADMYHSMASHIERGDHHKGKD